ncbi:MAG: serine hydrolase domain-containing protein [Halioglobus sp.]
MSTEIGAAVARGSAPGMVVVAASDSKILFEFNAGWADSENKNALNGMTALRQASVTKPYVAVTLLRLLSRADVSTDASLDTPIESLLPAATLESMKRAGYPVHKITLDHLLTHRAGLRQHSDSWRFKLLSMFFKSKTWTAQEQIDLMAEQGSARWPPGKAYAYSDTGYILLGQVIEHLTNRSLAKAVRSFARFDELGLSNTWWESIEESPEGSLPRAEQFVWRFAVSEMHPTSDLFGGGGLVASTSDVALFFDALFYPATSGGRVLQDSALLQQMLGLADGEPKAGYQRGLRVEKLEGRWVYRHAGVWGTEVLHVPSLKLTLAYASTNQRGFPHLRQLVHRYLSARIATANDNADQ